ncbi:MULTISPECIES: hypothetical protein [Burkholderiaceae]|uniref:Uncharacterized protein n=1 Tax=Pandoraea apista TaxID=93218 RepID=A0A5E5P7Y6_9BURK|nr:MULTISPECIES: hypothetical protein [Burkholderiaceae]VVG71899.1 hypothetical protein PAP18089_02889 [Pandoraea apista]
MWRQSGKLDALAIKRELPHIMRGRVTRQERLRMVSSAAGG